MFRTDALPRPWTGRLKLISTSLLRPSLRRRTFGDGASASPGLSGDSSLAIHYRVLDMMAEGVTVSDEDGIIQYTNAAADEMFGYDRGELLGIPPVQNAADADGARPLQTAGVWRKSN